MVDAMAITLYHHPHSRAATAVWMLEECGVPYNVHFLDLTKGEHKAPPILAKNPMGKLPILDDDGLIVTESAAIGLYLADRYSYGQLAPRVEAPQRGTYLRWSLFAPAVIEPGCAAKAANWDFRPGSVGWGTYEAMLSAIDAALSTGDYLLGDQFSMADVIFGGTLRYMLMFGMIDKRERYAAYVDKIGSRPAAQRAAERNASIGAEHGVGR